MGSKLATIFGLMLFFLSVMFTTDLIMLNVEYSSLNAAASNVAILYSKKGSSAYEAAKSYLNSMFNDKVTLTILVDASTVDSMMVFALSTYYEPIFINKESIKISVKRSAYIGNYIEQGE